jgi:hypothetical protein
MLAEIVDVVIGVDTHTHTHTAAADGHERAALATLLAARRSAVDAATDAQRQIHALVVTAPKPLRRRLRDQTTVELVRTCARSRVDSRWDITTRTGAEVLSDLARRTTPFTPKPEPSNERSSSWSAVGVPICSPNPVSDRSSPPPCCTRGHTPAASATKQRSRCSPAPHRSPPRLASPPATS